MNPLVKTLTVEKIIFYHSWHLFFNFILFVRIFCYFYITTNKSPTLHYEELQKKSKKKDIIYLLIYYIIIEFLFN